MKKIDSSNKTGSKILKIAVIGGADCSKKIYEDAYKIGYEIAARNAVLINGGLLGVMEASAKGAKAAGGTTIGILPGETEEAANPFIDFKIVTGMGYARNAIIIKSAHSVIAIDGGFGTLSEIGFALSYAKPLVFYNSWKLIPCSSKYEPVIHYARSITEAVDTAINLANSNKP